MDYVLVNDKCNTCRYVLDAFTLLRMPFKQITINEFKSDALAENSIIFVCPKGEAAHHDKIQSTLGSSKSYLVLVNCNDSISTYHDVNVLNINESFSEYDLKKAVTYCLQHSDNGIPFYEEYYPIYDKLIGKSKEISQVRSMIKHVAGSDSTVLILGPSGTGKDIVASCIHQLSNRKYKQYIPLNCGAIPSELIESELFGHEKGAFTGALAKRIGRFEMANLGTLFLDEIGDMPLQMQVKLLRVLQNKSIERVGGTANISVDVRLIAATNKNLEQLIQKKRFREDLFYRLNVFPIRVPSLHERKEDIPLLIEDHIERISQRLKHRIQFTDDAKEILCNYPWPGNIRELQNFLERMVILYPDSVISEEQIDPMFKGKKPVDTRIINALQTDGQFQIKKYIADIERELIEHALDRSHGSLDVAAEYLSIKESKLLEKMKKHKLHNENNE